MPPPRHNQAGDVGVMALSQLGIAVPSFWFAILLILLFAVKLQWVSAGGFPGWSEDDGGGLGPGLLALLLPAVALAAVQAAVLARCDPLVGARDAARRLRAHRARQGPEPPRRCCGGTCCATR